MKKMKKNTKKFEKQFLMKVVTTKMNQVLIHRIVMKKVVEKKMMLMKKNKKLMKEQVSTI